MSAASELAEDAAMSKDVLVTEVRASEATDVAFERIGVAVPGSEGTYRLGCPLAG